MLENLRLSFQSIWAHKMRSFLTMLGIIIGIAAIIAIVSTIKGTNDELKNELIGSGSNTVNIKLKENGNDLYIYSSSDLPYGVPQVPDSIREQILALDTVESVTCYTSRSSVSGIYYLNDEISYPSILGIDTSYFATAGYTIRSGRGFVEDDYTEFRTVIIIDSIIADNYFPNEDPVGKTLEISGTPFTIIGVVIETDSYEASIDSVDDYYTYASPEAGKLFVTSAAWPMLYCFDEPENVIVKATSTDDMENAGSKTEDILNSMISSSQSDVEYDAENLLTQAEQLETLTSSTNIQLIWIASISLLVGGIGVMNIMMVSVTERTSEIGLKKAIGARKGAILGQFLTESVVLTSIGGALGVGAGIGMAYIINKISGVAVAISIPASAIAVLFSMLIGIVFGLMPSMKAANLDPIEALRRE
ncbi:MAG: ABC transporter permease [Clostridiales bacterium]|nr:ABC transporter permease [Clostridiales bacterium]MCC8107345.1 ABC transporter permease [Clostridiales bacterium]